MLIYPGLGKCIRSISNELKTIICYPLVTAMISTPLQGEFVEEYEQDKLYGSRDARVVSFDFGGTLADLDKERHVAYFETFNELGLTVDVKLLKEKLVEAHNWWLEERKRTGMIWTEETRLMFIEKLFRLLNIDRDDLRDLALEFSKVLRYNLTFYVYDDVEPVLNILRDKGYLLIVVSNVSSLETLTVYLTQAGLMEYFILLVASGTIGFEKPHPEIYLYASRTLQIPPSRFVHIGNDYEKDYIGALNAGMYALLLDRENQYSLPQCKKISNLKESIHFIDEFLG